MPFFFLGTNRYYHLTIDTNNRSPYRTFDFNVVGGEMARSIPTWFGGNSVAQVFQRIDMVDNCSGKLAL